MSYSGWWSFIEQDEQQNKPELNRAMLGRVLSYARPYRGRIGALVASICGIASLSLLAPLLYRALIDQALPDHDAALLNWLALGMVLVPLLIAALRVTQDWLVAQVGNGIVGDLRVALFAHLQKMSLRFFTNTHTGELLSRLNSDVVGAQNAVTGTLSTIISNTITVVGTLSIMLVLEWRLTLVALLIVPCFVLPARRIGRVVRSISRRQMTYSALMNALMSETLNINGALLVKLFGRASDENARMKERVFAVRDGNVRRTLVTRSFFMILGLAGSLGASFIFWLGGHLALSGTFSVGTVVALGFYLAQLYGPLMDMTNARIELSGALVSFERVFEVLDLVPEVEDKPGAIDPGRINGAVQFEHVGFSYTQEECSSGNSGFAYGGLRDAARFGSPQAVRTFSEGISANKSTSLDTEGKVRFALKDISFEAQPGQLIALVGHSGAGKSTLTYLLPRLYDVTEGSVSIDGLDVRDLTLQSLAANIGVVTQETCLFHDTIRANLIYARPAATNDEIEAACRAANIHDFIANLPDEYDTVVGERGYRLSGGEKQRLAIARVLLMDPRILILDEATSSLDSETEALVQQALERLMVGRTSIVIAHRLSTVLAADLILVMQQGRIVERGTHIELLVRRGIYDSLYRTQFRENSKPSPQTVKNYKTREKDLSLTC